MTVHVPPRFREDNTEGYGLADLRELNRRFDERVEAEIGPEDANDPEYDELLMKSTLDHIAESVLVEYDRDCARAK